MLQRSSIIILIIVLFIFCGCATQLPKTAPIPVIPKIDENNYFYHKVEPKETLYRISKNFGVDIDDIIRLNSVEDPTKIEKGQLLVIPKIKREVGISSNEGEDFVWPIMDVEVVLRTNKGIDIKAPLNYNITAVKAGIVAFYSENFKNYGKTLIVKHSDNYSSVYCGFSEKVVNLGDTVTQGEPIAKNSGSLHFEIRKDYKSQNPYFYLPK
jgi:murein DD-endopeptidase MepM/ murein hydrolase activator NlpD